MDAWKWFRGKQKKLPPPPPLDFEIPIARLPADVAERVAAGARVSFRVFPAERAGRHKFRSRCVILLDDQWAAESEITWSDQEARKTK